MAALVGPEMDAGALGLSSGLEYDPGLYATTEEVVALAREAGRSTAEACGLPADQFLAG